jgi:class 3 adenylate cyclase
MNKIKNRENELIRYRTGMRGRVRHEVESYLNRKGAEVQGKWDTVVMSIDVRNSTELMKEALEPEGFYEFMLNLTKDLSAIVKNNFGVVDKFTGDGMLAYFPKIITGDYAALWAIKSALSAHEIFGQIYGKHEDSFGQVLADSAAGLGIGIDYGEVMQHVVETELICMGRPVIYACRLSDGDVGSTLINQQAKRLVQEGLDCLAKNPSAEALNIEFEKIEITPKTKPLKAHKLLPITSEINIPEPDWFQIKV